MRKKINNFAIIVATIITTCLFTSPGFAINLDLMQTYMLARQNDPTYQMALANYKASIENVPIQRSLLLPQIYFNGNVSRSGTLASNPQITQSRTFGLNLTQSIFELNQWFSLLQAYDTARQAAADLLTADQALIMRTATAYFNVLVADDNVTFTTEEGLYIAKQLSQTKQKFKAGVSPVTDVYEAQASFDQNIADKISAVNTAANNREILRQIINVMPDKLARLKANIPLLMPKPNDRQQWVEYAMVHNPALRSANYAAEANRQAIAINMSQHLPSFNLTGAYGGSNNNFNTASGSGALASTLGDNSLSTNDTNSSINANNNSSFTAIGGSSTGFVHYWSATFNANLNIYSGGLITAQTNQARSTYHASMASAIQTRRTVISNTEQAYYNTATSISQTQALQQAVKSAKVALDATQSGFKAGTNTIIDVLDLTSSLYQQKKNLAAARYNYVLSALTLKQAVGLISPQDLADINDLLPNNYSN